MHARKISFALLQSLVIILWMSACSPTANKTSESKKDLEKTTKEGDTLSIGDTSSEELSLSSLAITNLTISMDKTRFFVDQNARISVEITYEDDSTSSSDDALIFESSDTDIAEINNSGKLTLKQAGEVSIVAQADSAQDSITLTILESALHFVIWTTDDQSSMTIFSNNDGDILLTASDDKDCLPVDCENTTQLTLKPNKETALDDFTITTDTRFQISLSDDIHSKAAAFIDKKIFSPRKYHRAITFKNKLWIIGGQGTGADEGSFLSDIWSSPDGSLWTQEAPEAEFSGRENHSLSILNDKIILAGGWNDSDEELHDVWESEDGKSFSLLTENASFPARDSHATATINNTLYLMAGWTQDNGCDSFNDAWQTQDGKTWTEVNANTSFSKRCASAVTVFNDTLYLTGGMEGKGNSRKYLNDAWSSTDGDTFEQLTTSAPFATRFKHQMIMFNEALYLTGGFSGNNESKYFNDIWKSTDGQQWERVTETAAFQARAGHQMLVNGDWLYIIGGYNDQSTFQDVWRSKDGKNYEKRQGGHFPFD